MTELFVIISGVDLNGECGKVARISHPRRGRLEHREAGLRAIDRAFR